MTHLDERALEAAAKALCLCDDPDADALLLSGRPAWAAHIEEARAAVTAYLDALNMRAADRLDELERENARLREALQLIANAIHPRFRTEDDIDMLYANEKAFGQCINVARAALAGSGEK